MTLMDDVKFLEGKNDAQRRMCVSTRLNEMGLEPIVQEYDGGKNIIYNSGRKREVGIASHFDVAPDRDDITKMSHGANDNASAVAVVLDILSRYNESPLENIGVRGLFFDGEETGLRGSNHYVKSGGLEGLEGVYNLELVGQGNMVAFWADGDLYEGKLLNAIESSASYRDIQNFRFPGIQKAFNNSGDHKSFSEAGFNEAFCITAIGIEDVQLAMSLLGSSQGKKVNQDVLRQAPLFQHYHKVTDTSEHLSEESLKMVSNLLWDSLRELDKVAQ